MVSTASFPLDVVDVAESLAKAGNTTSRARATAKSVPTTANLLLNFTSYPLVVNPEW